jgi:hypothetical protein
MNKLTELNYVVIVVVLFLFIALTSNGAFGSTNTDEIEIIFPENPSKSQNTVIIWTANTVPDLTDLILALEQVESNGNETAYNESEKALGCLQIRPIMLADYNRIYGTSFTHDQMKSRSTSHLVAIGIFHHYGKSIKRNGETPNAKHLAFIWNGGGSAWRRVFNPKNDQKQINLETYWEKVNTNMEFCKISNL